MIYKIQGEKNQKVYNIKVDENAVVLGGGPVDKVAGNVPLRDIPGDILTAAKNEIPGFKILRALMIATDESEMVYELIGTKKFNSYYVWVTKDGRVLKSGLDAAGRQR